MNANIKMVHKLLKLAFVVVPIVAGLDKFTNILTNWTDYIAPFIADILPFEGSIFMILVGIIEIVAGALVIYNPRIGGLVVAGWLVAIGLSLILSGHHLDVAVRDIVMALGAFALSKLSEEVTTEKVVA